MDGFGVRPRRLSAKPRTRQRKCDNQHRDRLGHPNFSVVRSSDALRWKIETIRTRCAHRSGCVVEKPSATETTTLTAARHRVAVSLPKNDSRRYLVGATPCSTLKIQCPLRRPVSLRSTHCRSHAWAIELNPRPPAAYLTYEIEDKDADDRVTQTEIIWLIDGQPVGVFNETVLAPSFTRKHQRVTARIRVTDAYDATSLSVETPALQIKNTLPLVLSADVFPADDPSNLNCQNQACTQAQDFECVYSTMFDADGDSVTARYSWFERTGSSTSGNQPNDLMLPFQRISGQQAERGKSLVCGTDHSMENPRDGHTPRLSLENQIPVFGVQLNPRSPAEEI